MRSSTIAWRNCCTSKAGMITVVPPIWIVMISWLLQPVTWNIGTEMRLRMWSSCGEADDPPARLGVRQEVLVGRHRALREPGRAARVEDRGEVLVAEVVDDDRFAVGKRRLRARRRTTAPESVTTYSISLSVKRVFTGHGDRAEHLRRRRTRGPSRSRWRGGCRHDRRARCRVRAAHPRLSRRDPTAVGR